MKSRFLPKYYRRKVGPDIFSSRFIWCSLFTSFCFTLEITPFFLFRKVFDSPTRVWNHLAAVSLLFAMCSLPRMMKQDKRDSHLVIKTSQQNSNLRKPKTQVPFGVSPRWRGEHTTKTHDKCNSVLWVSEMCLGTDNNFCVTASLWYFALNYDCWTNDGSDDDI